MKIETTALSVSDDTGSEGPGDLIRDRTDAQVIADMAAEGWTLTAARNLTKDGRGARLYFKRTVASD